MIVLLLAVGFGVYSQKGGFKQGAAKSNVAEVPASLHHKIPSAPQPTVETEDTSIQSAPEDQTATTESETQSSAMMDVPSTHDEAATGIAVEKPDTGAASLDPLEPVTSSEGMVDEDTAAGVRQPADDSAKQDLNTGKSETPPVERTESPASVGQMAPSESTPTTLSETDATGQTAATTGPSTPKNESVPAGQTVPEPEISDKMEVSKPFYTIQVGAYRSLANAEQSVARMQSAGYDAYVIESGGPSVRSWYLVRFGRFDELAPAREGLNAYNQEHKAQAILTRSDRF